MIIPSKPYKSQSWEDRFLFRFRTGGNDKTSTQFANDFHPEDQRKLPEHDLRTGNPPKKETELLYIELLRSAELLIKDIKENHPELLQSEYLQNLDKNIQNLALHFS